MRTYLLALDQGTTSSRAVVLQSDGRVLSSAQQRFRQWYPEAGWVEHDPVEIWQSQRDAMQEALGMAHLGLGDIKAIGIANQRETTVLWDKVTGEPVARAIVWQCRRTAALCQEMVARGLKPMIRERTGLVLDAYFSATKIQWLLDNVAGLRIRAERGEVCFGTVDSWLVYNLTGKRTHVTDVTNASRTLLFNIHTRQWDPELLRIFNIPPDILPTVVPSAGYIGTTDASVVGDAVPIAGLAGDQAAALFGQGCIHPGMAKNTYGTGAFLLMHTGDQPVPPVPGLLTTLACEVAGGKPYALEGSIFMAGAVIDWLKESMGMIHSASESEQLALSVSDTQDVYLVPAFVGLGSPYWDGFARGTIVGLTRGSGRAHVVRAALESVAYQTRDVLDRMVQASGYPLAELRVDGGASRNQFLMQFQADILGVPVLRSHNWETTALGAAYLAGVGVGIYSGPEHIFRQTEEFTRFDPQASKEEVNARYRRWQKAVERSRGWALD